MTRLEYNYRYIESKRNGYHGAKYAGRQVANSVLSSAYEERYHWPRRDTRKAIIGICLIALAVFIGVLELTA